MNIIDKKKDNKSYNICTNCGNVGHEYKQCKEPIISWGIILVKTNNDVKIDNVVNNPSSLESYEFQEGIKVKNYKQLNSICTYMKSINFLLIRRKHSLGYMEFMRGRYVKDNIDGITYLFQQMTPNEIEKIKTLSFDELWIDLWGSDIKKIKLNKKKY